MKTEPLSTAKGYRKCPGCKKEYYLRSECDCDALVTGEEDE